jgi:hypothetical protein
MKSFATEDTEITEMKERVEDSQTEQIDRCRDRGA